MKRVIVNYNKLTTEILNLLVQKYPDGYNDSDIIVFRNAHNETIEAVEVRTDDTIYLVKISVKLAQSMLDHMDDEIPESIEIPEVKDVDLRDEEE